MEEIPLSQNPHWLGKQKLCEKRNTYTVYYVKEGNEIDFFDGETLYQVVYNIKDKKTKIREGIAFDSAGLEAKKLIIPFGSNEDV